jgi:nicotinamidase-related amidase
MSFTRKNKDKRKSRRMKKRHMKRQKKTMYRNKATRKVWNGGLKEIPPGKEGDLIYIWNLFLIKRIKDTNKNKNYNEMADMLVDEVTYNKYLDKPYALFVIDMQNDFVDRPYDRADYNLDYGRYDEKPEEYNLVTGDIGVRAIDKGGNFAVAGGANMIKEGSLLSEIIEHLKHDTCKKVVFSRDYHPPNHMSFSSAYSKTYGTNTFLNNVIGKGYNFTGNFPPHCIQCHNGSCFVKELSDFLKGEDSNKDILTKNKDKIDIIFKGMHPLVDSFSAVSKDVIDHYASNQNQIHCGNCGDITGGFKIAELESEDHSSYINRCVDYNIPDRKLEDKLHEGMNRDIWKSIKWDTYISKDIETIFVCGLAGDYCVRDTIISLEMKYPGKTIVLLQDYTRYAALPFFTILTCPRHISEAEYKEGKNKLNTEEDVMNIIKGDNFNEDKDIIYYLMDGSKKLLKSDSINTEIYKEALTLEPPNLNYNHFITSHKDILADYKEHKTKIYIKNMKKDYIDVIENYEKN